MGKVTEKEFDRQLEFIAAQFLCYKPIESIEWMDILHPDNMTTIAQDKLIAKTVNSSEFKPFKTKLSHRLRFLRYIITTLETYNMEIEDSVYESYTDLLQNTKSECGEELCKIYKLISFQTSICLPHSDQIIRDGSTGFYTWEASGALSEWALANPDKFRGRIILELGCGTGLCGFVIHRTCDPEFVCLTDGNEMVFDKLVKTKNVNYGDNYDGNLDIQLLDWNKTDESKLCNTYIPDVIIAADVIYDNSLFGPLSQTIKIFFDKSNSCKLYLACTIRNEDTLNEFLCTLDTLNLKRYDENLVPPTHIYWDNTTPKKYFRLKNSQRFTFSFVTVFLSHLSGPS